MNKRVKNCEVRMLVPLLKKIPQFVLYTHPNDIIGYIAWINVFYVAIVEI